MYKKVTYGNFDLTALTVAADQKAGWIELAVHVPDKSGQWVPLPDAGRHKSSPAPHTVRISGPNIKVILDDKETDNG